jgi:hypothetical protein
MRIITLVLNAEGEPHFRTINELDTDGLLGQIAEREATVHAWGEEKAAAAVPAFAQDLLKAVEGGENNDVDIAVCRMALACMLVDRFVGGMDTGELQRLDLRFVVRHDGAVARTYVPAGSPDPDVSDMVAVTWADAAETAKAEEPDPAAHEWPEGHPFANLMPSDAAENTYYADLFRIGGRNWMILGYGKSRAAQIASAEDREAMYGTDSIAILRRGDELWARYDLGTLPRSSHQSPELWTPRRLDAIVYCLNETQTREASGAQEQARTLIRSDAARLASLCATYPYPAYMAPQFFRASEYARLCDPVRMQRRFAELTHGVRGTELLLVPHMPSVEEKAALYRAHRFPDAA